MSIADKLRRWRDLARLKARVRSEPSPSAWGEYAERLIAFGEIDEALAAAEEGMRSFPDSERLAQVKLFAKKRSLTGQLRKLREDAQRRPSPVVFTQLAAIYRELGSQDEALEAAQQCADRYPLNEGPHLVTGEIRLERWLRDMIAKDGILAEEALRRVTRLNGHNVRAHMLLAELYWAAGDVSACRRHLRSVLSITPAAKEVQEFVRSLGSAETEENDEIRDFGDRARAIEESGGFPRQASDFPSCDASGRTGGARGRLDVESLRADVLALGGGEGVRNIAVLDRDGDILADHTDGTGPTRRQFCELVTATASVADDASRRMDTGALVRAEVESPSGNVTVVRVRGLTIGVLYSAPLRGERVWELVQDLVARNSQAPASAEAARA
ncbi:MAG: hypothetical protein HMLKMBBP_00331 [Planctomycetes bacterium]|nr:hypothetical protein [Planctomycetota bacterium]